MPKRFEIYKCEVCGNITEVQTAGGGTMVCCNQPMSLCTENTVDASVEKHVPFIEKIPGGYKVTIGSTIHPMDDDHYIEWIQIIADGKSYRQYLSPGDEPVAVFMIEAEKVTAREYCNLHGLWKAESE
ncbi:MAG: desulfoferrodoxin [Firmicutes bacterium]|nr:desulfoferrodoxin [Bacillota bacterium]